MKNLCRLIRIEARKNGDDAITVDFLSFRSEMVFRRKFLRVNNKQWDGFAPQKMQTRYPVLG